jgi:hypothetical protein
MRTPLKGHRVGHGAFRVEHFLIRFQHLPSASSLPGNGLMIPGQSWTGAGARAGRGELRGVLVCPLALLVWHARGSTNLGHSLAAGPVTRPDSDRTSPSRMERDSGSRPGRSLAGHHGIHRAPPGRGPAEPDSRPSCRTGLGMSRSRTESISKVGGAYSAYWN